MEPIKKRQCPKCKQAGLENYFFSEDGAAVFDQACKICGERAWFIAGEYAPKERWADFEAMFPIFGDTEGRAK